jgi:hypothetical protein
VSRNAEPARVALVLGGSNITLGANGPPLYKLLEEMLNAADAGEWAVRTAMATPGRSMAQRALAAVREHSPDAVVLAIPAAQFTYEFVVNRIRRRWPWLYRPALIFSQRLKAAAGGAGDENVGPRGLLYRVPEQVALRLIGGEPFVSVEHAIANATEAIEALAGLEDLALVVRQPVGGMRATRARARRYDERLQRFRSAISGVCDRHRITSVDVASRLREAGLRSGFGADGIHLDDATRRFEAGLLTAAILEAGGLAGHRLVSTKVPQPAPP